VSDNENLETRLRALEDERAVLRTLHQYAHAIDYGNEDGWVDCFAPDGAFEVRNRTDSSVSRLVGHTELKAFISTHTRAPDTWHKHIVIEPVIDIDGDTARSASYCGAFADDGDTPILWGFGRYLDQLVRGADGRWRFTERLAEVESVAGALLGSEPR
jgi:hypothetical protein